MTAPSIEDISLYTRWLYDKDNLRETKRLFAEAVINEYVFYKPKLQVRKQLFIDELTYEADIINMYERFHFHCLCYALKPYINLTNFEPFKRASVFSLLCKIDTQLNATIRMYG